MSSVEQPRHERSAEEHRALAATILIVTDSAELGALLQQALRAADYAVQLNDKGTFDLDAIARARPDLIVFDLATGEETRGWQYVQMLRLHPATATIAALVCTMQKTLIEEIEGHLLALSIGCLLKPFTAAQLLKALQRILAARSYTPLCADAQV